MMDESTELEGPIVLAPPADVAIRDHLDSRADLVPPLASGARRTEVEAELVCWYNLDSAQQQEALWATARNGHGFSIEALVHISRQAFTLGDRKTLNLAFEGLTKAAAPLLLSQANKYGRDLARDERYAQVQELLLKIFEAIRTDKADFLENFFAAFAKKQAISLYRQRKKRFEGANHKIEPVDDIDPIEGLPAQIPTYEARALLAQWLDNLSPKHRAVFIQYHIMGLTQEEIAQHHGVNVRSVYNWLKAAAAEIKLLGDTGDR